MKSLLLKRTKQTNSPEFRLEVAQQIVDQARSIRDVAYSLGLALLIRL
jgi:transposase